jgi:hypothetical protein
VGRKNGTTRNEGETKQEKGKEKNTINARKEKRETEKITKETSDKGRWENEIKERD